VVGVGEDSSVGVDVVSGLDLTSLHSVGEQTHFPVSLSLSVCYALPSKSTECTYGRYKYDTAKLNHNLRMFFEEILLNTK